VFAGAPAVAQSLFATQVVSYTQGTGGGIFVHANILGGPQGGGLTNGSVDVLSLGSGGSVTLGFDVTITDGPGADFSVFENALTFGGAVFAEVALIEVSTNGTDFARIPTRYDGPAGPLPPFGGEPMGTFAGMTGGMPILTNVVTNSISPFDPVVSGGESFDLADLANDPLVVSGLVDLAQIHFVRLVDAPEGVFTDSFGHTIWDNGGSSSSADIDAVAVIQHTGIVSGHGPVADLWIDAQGFLNVRLGDPDGVQDLDLATLSMSLDLAPIPFKQLRRELRPIHVSATEVHMRSIAPIWGQGIRHALALSVRDHAGEFSGDQCMLQH
jgi:hypothetical protein